MHLWQLIKDAWSTSQIWDKIRIWFMPTGWRPADVSETSPIDIIMNVYEQKKYNTNFTKAFLAVVILHFAIANILQYFLLVTMPSFSFYAFSLCASFIFVSIFAFTSLMDGHWLAIPGEIGKIILGIVIVLNIHLLPIPESYVNMFSIAIIGYLVFSILSTLYYLRQSHFIRSQEQSSVQM
jgi:hypothetical protein